MIPPPVSVRLAAALAVAALAVQPAGVAAEEPDRPSAAGRPNVLMILVDDLKPALGCYGDAVAQTPHMDALAARGVRFDAAYCNQAVCAPSRFTLMLGSHSTSTGLYGLGSHLRQALPDAVTLPQRFAAAGYRTESLGKVFHIGHGNQGDPESFMVPHFKDKVIEYVAPENVGGPITREEALFGNVMLDRIGQLPRGAAYESPDVPDDAYADGRVTAETVRRLRDAKARREAEGTPFFIACGLARPHMPFSVPQRYWDLYDPDELPAAEFVEAPDGAPGVAIKRGGEINAYKPIPDGGDPEPGSELAKTLVHGYYAGVSYADAQVGKLIAALDELGLAENTVVVLWGDHGFHLGDHGIWTKHTNFEQAARIPLLFAGPGVSAGAATGQLAESVDVFPTLTELCGLPTPRGPQPIDGVSLVPVLKDPAARVRDHAYHVFPKQRLGRAIRTDRYRLVEWIDHRVPEAPALLELYDYRDDPLETRNLAEERPQVVERLRATLADYPKPLKPGETPAQAAAKPAPPMTRAEIAAGLEAHD
ncbi:sulfatase [Alienimonas californiensis]|uniref:Arylsulfatase n=1 Tax=Alienimonas californiensis TaxID=2527989 RepID=A0A517P7A9_9PLAN|nr:sulfatase [Alienimonas californiensis]QDT15235.1 Arylsulfatase [Alienimonas californiensis]